MGKFDLRNKYKNNINKKETHLKEIVQEKSYLVNYEELELNNEQDVNTLKSYEEESVLYFGQATKNIYEFSRVMYEARELLAKYGSGKFVYWFEKMGLKRTFVYDCISRYEVLIKFKSLDNDNKYIPYDEESEKEIINLPIKVINQIKKFDLNNNEIKKVVDSFDYEKTINEIKETKIINAEIVDDKQELNAKDVNSIKECESLIYKKNKEYKKVILKKEKLYEKIKEIEKEIGELAYKETELYLEIEDLDYRLGVLKENNV